MILRTLARAAIIALVAAVALAQALAPINRPAQAVTVALGAKDILR